MTSKVKYSGNLRTEAEHLKSGAKIITDAPTDNHGKGEAFSPTDTVATALASCMLTVMGIKAETLEIDLSGTTADVTKTMASNPRRIEKVEIDIVFPESYPTQTCRTLEQTAKTCPVFESLHPDMEKVINFSYS